MGGPVVMIHVGSGGLNVQAGGVRSPAVVENDLEMAAATSNKINLQRLCDDNVELKEVLSLIMDKEAFGKLFLEGLECPSRVHKRISRKMLKHLPTLLECDQAERVSDDEMIDFLVCFLVRKKNGLGRFICNCRPLNHRQAKPGPMNLPAIRDVIDAILRWKYAAQCDGTTFFCQFELAEDIRRHFACRLTEMRGEIVSIILRRMPMGWSHAPRIAQAVANHIMKDIGVGWVDNFIFGATSLNEFFRKRKLLRQRLDRYNVQVDDMEMTPTTNFFALGLEFDLEGSRFRLDPSWIEKRREIFQRAHVEVMTYRQAFELFGSLVWTAHVKSEPLWLRAESLAMLSLIASEVDGRWDESFSSPSYARKNLIEWSNDALANAWCGSPRSRVGGDTTLGRVVLGQETRMVFSDASDHGCAWVSVSARSIVAGQRWRRAGSAGENIFLGELEALLGAYQRYGAEARYAIDNLGLKKAVDKGHSSSYTANVRMREKFRRTKPSVEWVPTEKNIADPFSRDAPLPTFPAPIQDWVIVDDGVGYQTDAISSKNDLFCELTPWIRIKTTEERKLCF
jgi:hypothetical protein